MTVHTFVFFFIAGVYFQVLNTDWHIAAKHEAECIVLKDISVYLGARLFAVKVPDCKSSLQGLEAWVIKFTPFSLCILEDTYIR